MYETRWKLVCGVFEGKSGYETSSYLTELLKVLKCFFCETKSSDSHRSRLRPLFPRLGTLPKVTNFNLDDFSRLRPP